MTNETKRNIFYCRKTCKAGEARPWPSRRRGFRLPFEGGPRRPGKPCRGRHGHGTGFPPAGSSEAEDFCRREGIRQIVYDFDVMAVEGFSENPPDRCYLCKRALFQNIQRIASENGLSCVVEGLQSGPITRTTVLATGPSPSWESKVRFGTRALRRPRSGRFPMSLAFPPGISLPTLPCLPLCLRRGHYPGEAFHGGAGRAVPDGSGLPPDAGARPRNLARVEVPPEDIPRLLSDGLRRSVSDRLKSLGFSYVTLDLAGFRSGSMNEALKPV